MYSCMIDETTGGRFMDDENLVTKIGTRGQTTIPIKIRKHLNISANDRLIFQIEKDGSVKIQKVTVKVSVKPHPVKKTKS